MQIIIWIVIILLAIFFIRLLRKWIKRLIFILILLCLAFFIYGIFSPSGAARLRYNIRTFPQRVISRTSNQSFINYDSYKLNTPSRGLSDKSNNNNAESFSENDSKSTIQTSEGIENDTQKTTQNIEKDQTNSADTKKDTDKDTSQDNQSIRSFSGNTSIQFVEMNPLTGKNSLKQVSENSIFTGYSKSDLLGIINKYIENNLDDDTNILVTVEYSDENSDPDKIILETQPKSEKKSHSVSLPHISLKNRFRGLSHSKTEKITITSSSNQNYELFEQDIKTKEDEIKDSEINDDEVKADEINEKEIKETETQITTSQSVSNSNKNSLSQKEIHKAEELFSILF